jgi:hypothetical protein
VDLQSFDFYFDYVMEQVQRILEKGGWV